MKRFLCLVAFLSAVCIIHGRSYGPPKKKVVKKPMVIPDTKLPLCHGGCTRQWIAPECREETYGFENGVKCKGCDRDICRGPIGGDNVGLDRWQNGPNWQSGGNVGLDSWQNGPNWQSGGNGGFDSWQNGQNWQSGGNRRGDGFLNQGLNGGFLDSLGNNDFLNRGQGGFLNNRNNVNNFQNGQIGNQW